VAISTVNSFQETHRGADMFVRSLFHVDVEKMKKMKDYTDLVTHDVLDPLCGFAAGVHFVDQNPRGLVDASQQRRQNSVSLFHE
jgi:hypothetical protein